MAITDFPPFCNACKGFHWGYCNVTVSPYITWYTTPPAQTMRSRCLSTYIYRAPHTLSSHGIQCKFDMLHTGKHCGYADHHVGDVTWTDEEANK